MDARKPITAPMPAATYSPRTTSSSSVRPVRQRGTSTAGSTPQAPAVGAATILRMQALDSATHSAVAMTSRR